MILVKPSFEIINMSSVHMEDFLEIAGRTCYKSEGKGDCAGFVRKLIKGGHESVIEHGSISVKIICDRGVTHEIVRHRLASYSQESTRYCNYSGGVTFVIPPWIDLEAGEYDHPSSFKPLWELLNSQNRVWAMSMYNSEQDYIALLSHGWSPQQARSVLPNSLKTEIIMTCNLREWRHFFKLRTSKAAHPQMREIAVPMLERFRELIPVVFEDIPIEERKKDEAYPK